VEASSIFPTEELLTRRSQFSDGDCSRAGVEMAYQDGDPDRHHKSDKTHNSCQQHGCPAHSTPSSLMASDDNCSGSATAREGKEDTLVTDSRIQKAGDVWPEEQRKFWLDTADSIFKMDDPMNEEAANRGGLTAHVCTVLRLVAFQASAVSAPPQLRSRSRR
jgi:hypothetical protein